MTYHIEYKCHHCKDKGFVYERSWDSPNTFGGFGMVDVVPVDCEHCQKEDTNDSAI